MTIEERMKQEYKAAMFYLKQSEKFRGRREYDEMTKCIKHYKEKITMYEWLKELKVHREAWEKVLNEMIRTSVPGQTAECVYQNIYKIIIKNCPQLNRQQACVRIFKNAIQGNDIFFHIISLEEACIKISNCSTSSFYYWIEVLSEIKSAGIVFCEEIKDSEKN